LGVASAGHAGTLDPNVSGLLWVGVGPALKLIPLVLEFPKRYVGVVAFHGPVAPADVERAIREFTGPVFQTPPVRSAVKRERRIRTLHRLVVVEAEGTKLLIDVVADSGTYVRTLAVDLGEALGVGGHLEELRRVGTGPFTEAQAVSMTQLADAVVGARAGDAGALLPHLHPLVEVWGEFPILRLKPSATSAIAHGADLSAGGILTTSRRYAKGAHVVLTSAEGDLLAFGRALLASDDVSGRSKGWVVDAERVFADPARYPPRWGRAAPKATPP
ncbi:MAG: RNA-guided pseudouridylation complex pseudouridine synthase subunit Cbf5, partial [Thermoplasmata archaeon]|nr:RNA-guided pseudouridylation complex pseudouridine synthase subunit Cbf5 [Thermoplasmata archaeon]